MLLRIITAVRLTFAISPKPGADEEMRLVRRSNRFAIG